MAQAACWPSSPDRRRAVGRLCLVARGKLLPTRRTPALMPQHQTCKGFFLCLKPQTIVIIITEVSEASALGNRAARPSGALRTVQGQGPCVCKSLACSWQCISCAHTRAHTSCEWHPASARPHLNGAFDTGQTRKSSALVSKTASSLAETQLQRRMACCTKHCLQYKFFSTGSGHATDASHTRYQTVSQTCS